MYFNGMWQLCEDGIVRPTIQAEVQRSDDSWLKVPFLIDSGADRTVISADVFRLLNIQPDQNPEGLIGVGGIVRSVLIETSLRLTDEDGRKGIFKGHFAAFVDVESLDTSVLGRDILNLFALIIDRKADTICLLSHPHFYTIGKR